MTQCELLTWSMRAISVCIIATVSSHETSPGRVLPSARHSFEVRGSTFGFMLNSLSSSCGRTGGSKGRTRDGQWRRLSELRVAWGREERSAHGPWSIARGALARVLSHGHYCQAPCTAMEVSIPPCAVGERWRWCYLGVVGEE